MPMMSPYYGYGIYSPYMMPYPYGGGRSTYSVEKYDMGELVIDFIDTKKDKVVMRISAVGEITKPKQKTKNLFTSAEKILKEFSKYVEKQVGKWPKDKSVAYGLVNKITVQLFVLRE